MSGDDSLFLIRSLPVQGAGHEPRGGGLLWLRHGLYGEVWGWGWIGWSRSTKEARGDPNASLTCLSCWCVDGSIATCHIITDTGGRTRHSDSASLRDGKLPICKRDSLPVHSAARRESSACGCVSELIYVLGFENLMARRWLFHRWWIGVQTETRWWYFTSGFLYFHLLGTWCRAEESSRAGVCQHIQNKPQHRR